MLSSNISGTVILDYLNYYLLLYLLNLLSIFFPYIKSLLINKFVIIYVLILIILIHYNYHLFSL